MCGPLPAGRGQGRVLPRPHSPSRSGLQALAPPSGGRWAASGQLPRGPQGPRAAAARVPSGLRRAGWITVPGGWLQAGWDRRGRGGRGTSACSRGGRGLGGGGGCLVPDQGPCDHPRQQTSKEPSRAAQGRTSLTTDCAQEVGSSPDQRAAEPCRHLHGHPLHSPGARTCFCQSIPPGPYLAELLSPPNRPAQGRGLL